jgi:hypothetical protein
MYPAPRGPRRAVVKVGEPIDVRKYLQPGGRRARDATAALTDELEVRIQALMDDLGPGRPLPPSTLNRGSGPGARCRRPVRRDATIGAGRLPASGLS